MTNKAEHPGKGKGKSASSSSDKPSINKKGQQCIRFFRGTSTRGDQCEYGHILAADGKPLKIAPELLERFDKYAAAKREVRKKETFSTQMLVLNAIGQADSRCFCLLDTGANALVLPRKSAMEGTEAQCTRFRGSVVPGTVVQVLRFRSEGYHTVAIEGASPLMALSSLILLAGWSHLPKVCDGRMQVKIISPEGAEVELTERSKMHYLDQDTFLAVKWHDS